MQTIILLHGALGTAADLSPLASALKDRGFSAHTFSFSGHGGNAFQADFGIGQFATELEAYINNNQLQPAAVFGYSMGGFVALHLAARQPALISKVITLATKFNWSNEAVEKETAGLDPKKMLEKIPAFATALQLKHGHSWEQTVTSTSALMKEIGSKQFLSPEVLKTITTPVLLGLGDRDKMVTIEETIAAYKNLPQAAMYMLPDTKHPLETVNTEWLAQLIIDFLKKPEINFCI